MPIEAIGAVLPAALAVGLGPFPVVGVVLLLAGGHGRRNGPLFAPGRVAGIAVVAVLVAVVFRGADDPESTSSAVAGWLRVAAGAALIVPGVRKWSRRPQPVTRSTNRAGWHRSRRRRPGDP
ncbi:GAP family protein [Streptomyces sp. NBC_00233]|uniref:GAP family protein n=1 Tax=Streptomyces sp. NBC_00233 TaxID=2975686 RepID=UPI00224DBFFF|nr:GAP family protein [Streptomyces sp. NBC_00233]MCX5229262.1 GAP family protein [Streptomyces sp. NBC_00233]